MRISAFFAFLLFAAVAVADTPPTFPTTFYGVITTTGGTPAGQTLNAALGSATASATVANTNLYSCGGSTCNYYLTISRASGDTSSTNVTFTINSNNIGDGSFSSGAVVRKDFSAVPESYLEGAVIGSSSDIISNGTGTLSITINGTTPGTSYNTTLPVNVSSGNGVVLSFDFDFGNSSLNLSKINISVGNSSGKSYISVSGVNDSGGQSGTKTLVIHGANTTYNGICVEDVEAATYLSISSDCTGTNEVRVPCNGTASGITCTQSGTTITISGLSHSAAMQYSIPATTTTTTTSSGSSSGGGSVGGGGSGSSTQQPAEYSVDVGSGNSCSVSIKRELTAGDTLSVLTTTLTNNGGSICTMTDFVFADTIPESFAAIDEINFTPPYNSKSGSTVYFNFPSFIGGESKTIAYSVGRWVPPSRVKNFTTYTMSAKKQVAAPPVNQTQNITTVKNETLPPELPKRDSHGCNLDTGSKWCDVLGKCIAPNEACAAPPKPPQPKPEAPNYAWLILSGLFVLVAIVAGVVYFLVLKRKKHGL